MYCILNIHHDTGAGSDYEYRHDDMVAFVQYFVEQTKAKGIGTFYWMGLSDGEHRSVSEFNQQNLVDAIVKGYYGESSPSAINSITTTSVRQDAIHTLSGQHVSMPAKGIYIQNGKKIIIK